MTRQSSQLLVSNSPTCPVCNLAVPLETAKTDEQGRAVHEQCYFSAVSDDRKLKLIPKMGPHLIERDGQKMCSHCSVAFGADGAVSISRAFAAHIRKDHPRAEPAFTKKKPTPSI